ncbi:hypothetical protein [Rheinheimera sp.]|jgi:hypothetical protein|uniref:hypothetical protein n=1 Tax=Rheinheimera sp. TaxID=1869214 RepID=UPI00262AB2FB|nr:hypothetical protein [Rheinheimera sp.]MCA1929939.1 hypothetical protein [Rheinheimera sp.]
MTQSVGSTAVSQSYELLGASLAKSQQKQEGRQTMQLLESAVNSSPALQSPSPGPVGSLGQNIDIKV